MENLVYTSEHWIVKLNPDQYHLGRCVIVLKRNCESLSELKREEILDFFDLVKKLESSIKKAFGAEMFNWTCLMNDAYKELRYENKEPSPQVHWHLRPRYRNTLEVAGEVFKDEYFAHHYPRKTDKEVPDEVKKEIIKRIRENIE